MKTLILLSTLFFLSIAQAENVSLKFSALEAEVQLDGISVDQVQTKLRCVFFHKKRGGYKISRRYPFTQIIPSQDSFKIKIKKSSLREWLPGFKLESCAFVLITMGKDQEGKGRIGDIVLMGQLRGEMSERDLAWMQNESDANAYIQKRLNQLKLGMGQVRGKPRIVEVE